MAGDVVQASTEPGVFVSLTQVATLVISAGVGLLVWGIKRGVEAVSRRLDCIEKSQHACQLSNAETFATTDEVEKLRSTVAGHGERISALEARAGTTRQG